MNEKSDTNPALFYRALVRDFLFRYSGSPDDRFREYLQNMWRGGEQNDPVTISIIAAGLLSFGDKTVLPKLLAALPSQLSANQGKVMYLAGNALKALLPLPAEMRATAPGWYDYLDKASLVSWVQKEYSRLEWDELSGVFRLRTI